MMEKMIIIDVRYLQYEHVLAHILSEREEAPLGVVPGVCVQLLVVRIQGLDDPGYTELEVPLSAVESADHC